MFSRFNINIPLKIFKVFKRTSSYIAAFKTSWELRQLYPKLFEIMRRKKKINMTALFPKDENYKGANTYNYKIGENLLDLASTAHLF